MTHEMTDEEKPPIRFLQRLNRCDKDDAINLLNRERTEELENLMKLAYLLEFTEVWKTIFEVWAEREN